MDSIESFELTICEIIGEAVKSDSKHYHWTFSLNGKEFRSKYIRPSGKNRAIWDDHFTLRNEELKEPIMKMFLWGYRKKIAEAEIDLASLANYESNLRWYKVKDAYSSRLVGRLSIKRNKIKKKKIKSESFAFIDYIMISELLPKKHSDEDKMKKPEIFCFRYPEKDIEKMPLTSLSEINLFSFPIYFSFRENWSPPIVFHFTLTINVQRIYGSSLIYYRKLGAKRVDRKLYEPISITILSRNAFLDQFSATLKYIYFSFFHNSQIIEKGAPIDLKTPSEELIHTIKFFCHEVPVPNSKCDVNVVLKPFQQTSFPKNHIDLVRKKTASVLDNETGPLKNHPIVTTHEEGVTIKPIPYNRFHLEKYSRNFEILPRYIDIDSSEQIGSSRSRELFKNFVRMGSLLLKAPRMKRIYSEPSMSSSWIESVGRTNLEREFDHERKPFTMGSAMAINNNDSEVNLSLQKSNDFFALPLLSVNLYQNLFNVMDIHTIVKVFACIMCEINIVFYSSQVSLLTKIQECFKALLFPFKWSHIYVPNLPKQLLYIVEAPVPFMVGLNKAYMPKIRRSSLKNKVMILYVDIDSSTIEYPSSIPTFPAEIRTKLVEKLRRLFKPEIFESDSIFKHSYWKYSDSLHTEIRKTFLLFLHELLGDYRGFLNFLGGKVPSFNTSKYCEERDKIRQFFPIFTGTHMFSSFIQKHLHHRAYLLDYVEYICNYDKIERQKKTITVEFPPDLDKGKNEENTKKIMNEHISKNTNFLLEKSNLEKLKPTEKNRISICLENFFMKSKTVSNAELASISELMKFIEWREFFTAEVVIWIKSPLDKDRVTLTLQEKKRLNLISSLSKIGLSDQIFGDFGFLFHVLLTECEYASTSKDYRIAKNLLDAATIFYNNSSLPSNNPEKMEFLIKSLLSHKLLKNNDFWKEILVNEMAQKSEGAEIGEDWAFRRIIRYAQQMVDLNNMKLKEILDCVDFWGKYCELNDENLDTLKKAVKNLENSKNVRISEYLSGNYGNLSHLEFIDKFGMQKKNLIPDSREVKDVSVSIHNKEETKSAVASKVNIRN